MGELLVVPLSKMIQGDHNYHSVIGLLSVIIILSSTVLRCLMPIGI